MVKLIGPELALPLSITALNTKLSITLCVSINDLPNKILLFSESIRDITKNFSEPKNKIVAGRRKLQHLVLVSVSKTVHLSENKYMEYHLYKSHIQIKQKNCGI